MTPRIDAPGRRGLIAVSLLLFAWFAATAWLRPLTLPDEGRYGSVAWEMLSSGRWGVPLLDGLPFFHKPPLFYWISAGAMQWFGVHPWVARMPSLLGATLAAAGLFAFTRRWSGAVHARGAVVVLATQPFFYVGAQFANLDMLVAGCISATVLLGAHAMLLVQQQAPYRAPLAAAYAMAALSVLAKGLIGIVLPGGVLIVWLLVARRPRLLLKLVWLPGLLVFVAVGLPWHWLMQLRYPGFFDYFVIYQHFQRFSTGEFNNRQPFWFYVPVLLLLTLPWSLALPAALRRPASEEARLPLTSLMWSWAGVVVVFFSLPASKLVGYVLPALPPLAWLLARALSGTSLPASRLSKRAGTLAVLAALVCVAVPVGVVLAHLPSQRALGLALRAERQPGEPVIFVRRPAYDVPFYARLEQPPMVLDDWNDPQIALRDDWRKELWDAGHFDPAAARTVLIGNGDLVARLCAAPAAWLVASAKQVKAQPEFRGAEQVATARDVALWKLPRAALNCGGTPSAGSTHR